MIYFRLTPILFLLLMPMLCLGQIVDSTEVSEVETDVVEDFLNNTDGESFEFNTLFENLAIAAKNKLDLNKASVQEIVELGIVDELGANAIVQHVKKYGKLISLIELQTIDQLSMEDISNLYPYVSVAGGIDDFQVSIQDMLLQGKNELYLRWSSLLENQEGFLPLEPDETSQRFLGSKDRIYARFKHSYEDRLSYGFTVEKDPGEEFFRGSNSAGFDYSSAHLFVRKWTDRVRAIAVGDFNAGFGQGLILNSGFGRGKSADAVRIKRNGYTLRPYTSVAENDFLRGAGATIGLSDALELSFFGSRLQRDANIVVPDTLDQEEFFFSSLQNSGLHRTPNEIEDENSITQSTLGGNLTYSDSRVTIGANVLYNTFDRPFARNIQPANQFQFNSDKLLNASVDYTYIRGSLHFFGETAISDNGAIASINSLLFSLDRKAALVVSYRNYDKRYQALNANGFGETNTVNNENGLYLGLELEPARKWRVNAYVDIWQHPWLRFNVDAPSTGFEYLTRLTYTERRKMEFYTQVRIERKQRNNTQIESTFDQLENRTRSQLRFHYATKLTAALELRTRLELSAFTTSSGIGNETGYLLYQDFIYKPRFSPFSMTSRIALFDTDDFNSRIFAYESDLLFNFSIPAYFNKGVRYYVNFRYKPTRSLTLELRFAQSRFRDLESISSGINEIQGNTRSEVKAQIKYQF